MRNLHSRITHHVSRFTNHYAPTITWINDEALAVDTVIINEKGQWVVYMDVIFWDETVRRRIQAYPTRRQAEIAASWMKRAAQRNLPQAPTGED